MLLCDFFIDQDWAIGYAEVRKLCAAGTVKVNGEVETNFQRPVNINDKVTCGKHREGIVS